MVSALALSVLTIAVGILAVGGAPPPCCTSKMVGGVEYILRREEDTTIFEKTDSPGPLFYFAAGDLEVVCDDTEGGSGSGPPPEGGNEGGSGGGSPSEGGSGGDSPSEGGSGSGPPSEGGNEGGSGDGSPSEGGSGDGSPSEGGGGSGSGAPEGENEGGKCTYPEGHTMIKYQGPVAECGYDLTITGLDQATKDELLKTHNEKRQKVASGSETGQPGASNMRKLTWNDELAEIAQRWAGQCSFGHDETRNLCDG